MRVTVAPFVPVRSRAVKWMFAGAGAPLPADGVEVLNMRTDTAGQVVAALLGEGTPEAAS